MSLAKEREKKHTIHLMKSLYKLTPVRTQRKRQLTKFQSGQKNPSAQREQKQIKTF